MVSQFDSAQEWKLEQLTSKGTTSSSVGPGKISQDSSSSEQWLDENRKAVARYNEAVEEHGVFSDGTRCF